MVTENLNSDSSTDPIGAVFTPVSWCEWIIERYGLFEEWQNGKTIFDPTSGEGNFIIALLNIAERKGIKISNSSLENLYINERQIEYIHNFKKRLMDDFGIHFPEKNIYNTDIVLNRIDCKFDILLGNPPWITFNNLSDNYKENIKPFFKKYIYQGGGNSMLLGSSRADLATLICVKTIAENLSFGGSCYFFIPISLFFGTGANDNFRTFQVNDQPFQVSEVLGLSQLGIFPNISTDYGFFTAKLGSQTQFPIPFLEFEKDITQHDKFDLIQLQNTRSMIKLKVDSKLSIPRIISADQPRQGVNTCGLRHLFVFDTMTDLENGEVEVSNQKSKQILPKKYIYPLFSKNIKSTKYILIPYHRNGKILTPEDVANEPKLSNYLNQTRSQLESRKGVMLSAQIKKGLWWALLGVGKYSFSKYKVIWQSYGDTNFHPTIIDGNIQGDQSMQAFIPVDSYETAVRICHELSKQEVNEFLHALGGKGKMNWAQPGKIKLILDIQKEGVLF